MVTLILEMRNQILSYCLALVTHRDQTWDTGQLPFFSGTCRFLLFRKRVTKTLASKSCYEIIDEGREKALSYDTVLATQCEVTKELEIHQDRSSTEAKTSEQESEEKHNIYMASKYLHTSYFLIIKEGIYTSLYSY